MSETRLTSSRVNFNGIDLGDTISDVIVIIDHAKSGFQQILPGLRDLGFTLRGYFDPDPRTYRQLWRRTHPRITRMHCAYRARRRGRW